MRVLFFICISIFMLQAGDSEDLLDLFENVTETTKKSNINIDHQASALSVIYTNELELLGIRTLSEALDFVPGIESSVTVAGVNRLSVRGASNPNSPVYESVRFFIDGVDIQYMYFANFPLELIERIEVFRGSATALYGQGAFSAYVNIITKSSLKNEENLLNFEYGSFDSKKASTVVHTSLNDIEIGFDAHYQEHERKVDASAAKDTLIPAISAVAFPRNRETLEGLRDKGIGISISKDEWRFTSRYLQTYRQNYIGASGLLDFNEDGYTKYTSYDAQISYQARVSNFLKLKSKIGMLSNSYELNSYLYLFEPTLRNPHYKIDYTRETYFGDVSLLSDYFDKHTIEIGVHLAKVKIAQNDFYTNVDANAQVGLLIGGNYYPVSDALTRLSGSLGLINIPGDKEDIASYYLQDLYNLTQDVDVVLNIRYDDYEYFDKKVSYKLMGVYSSDDVNIFKLLYSKAYRLPSLVEAFLVDHFGIIGTSTLKAESVESYEVGYSHITSKEIFKINAYYSIYRDSIDLYDSTPNYYYNNPQKQYSQGLEFEYSQEFENNQKLIINAAYTKFKHRNDAYTSYGADTPDASPFTLDAAYIFPLTQSLTWSNLLKYKSSKELSASSATIASSFLYDTTLHYVLTKDFTTNIKVKNVFASKYYYPSSGLDTQAMLREGRTVFVNLKYLF